MTDILKLIREAGARFGLNLVAAIPATSYNAAVASKFRISDFAEALSIVVIGNGGGTFWQALKDHTTRNPGWWDHEHPVDDFTREIVEREIIVPIRSAGVRCRVSYPFQTQDVALNFMELGKIAGIGGPSIIGVLVNPAYGPWIAFRAALMVDADLDEPGEALGFDPCPSCTTRSCITACPASAVGFPQGWDIPRCLTYRVEAEADCAPRCHARAGCVLGPEHRYPEDELKYHQMRALRAMRPYYRKRGTTDEHR